MPLSVHVGIWCIESVPFLDPGEHGIGEVILYRYM